VILIVIIIFWNVANKENGVERCKCFSANLISEDQNSLDIDRLIRSAYVRDVSEGTPQRRFQCDR
jgi:hypothetical protein